MTKIIQISDPHIVPSGQLAYGRVDTAAALANCVKTINDLLPQIGKVDLAFVAGDLTDFGTMEEYELFRTIMEPLQIPYRAIPGNHDEVEVMRLAFSDQDWMPKSGSIDWTAEFEDIALIGLDTKVAGKAHGHLSDTSLDYLQNQLFAFQKKPILVATHHPPVLTGIEKMDIQNLRDSQKLQTILSNHPGEVRLVCGHMHRNIVTPFGSVICQIAPGVSHAVSLDQREGAPNCLTKEPGAFLMHEVRSGIFTHTIPVGKFDGPHLFYPDKN
ncbi:MAG: phosphodiesterase [Rhizobiaceae bacterium]